MGRPFAACLGSIALIGQIVIGLIANSAVETILIRGTLLLVALSVVGGVIGKLADAIVRENIEAAYRRQVEELKAKQSAQQSTNLT